MCRTRAEEHVTSMNSAIFTSQKMVEIEKVQVRWGIGW
jgi:hypothetical protein